MNQAHFEIYPAANGEYGWRFRSANGQIIAVAGETFTRKADARRAASTVLAELAEKSRDLMMEVKE